MGEDMVYTLQETAEKLKCSVGAVRNMIARGELKVMKFGRVVRVPATELERILTVDSSPKKQDPDTT